RHDHPVSRLRVAGDRGPGGLLDVHHAEAALPGDREAGMVAVVRDLDADPPRRLDEVCSGRDLDRVAVDRELRHARWWPRGTRAWNRPTTISASGIDTVSSITITPAEPAIVPALRSPSTSIVTSISSARRIAADAPPGTTALSRPLPVTPPASSSMSRRRVIATEAS